MRWEEVVLRLVLALVVGGTIGAEREREIGLPVLEPIPWCVGSALVFLTSEFILTSIIIL